MYEIFARIDVKSMLHCRSVCKKWLQLINDEKRLINRLVLCIHGKHFRDITMQPLQFLPEIIPKFTNLKLVRMNFDEQLSEYLLALLPAVQELKIINCLVEQHDMMTLFDTMFSVSNRSVDQFELDDFTILSSASENTPAKRIKLLHCESRPLPIIKNLNIKISDIEQAITFFENLKDMNVKVQRLSIHLDGTDDMCKNFHYEKLNELLNLFHIHYQHLIKELTIDLNHVRLDLDQFYGRLSAMQSLQLEVLQINEDDGPWLGGVFKMFIKNQHSLKSFESQKELDREAVDTLIPIFLELNSLKMEFTTDENSEYFWSHFPVSSNLRNFKIITKNQLKRAVIDFEKVPILENLEIKNLGLGINVKLEIRNLAQPMIYLKKLNICHVLVDDTHLKLIFAHLCHLEELKLWKIGVS
jgi:F-box domain